MEKNKSFGHRFVKKQDEFFNSKKSFIIFVTTVIIFAVLQILLFLLTDFEVSGSSDINHWQSWLYMIISPLGASLSLIGYVYTVRVDKRFFIPTAFGQLITLISSFLGGMVWTGGVMFVILILGLVRMLIIRKQGSNYKLNFRLIKIISIIALIIASVIGIVMATNDSIYNTFWYTGDTTLAYRILDILTANLAIYGTVLLICKNRNAFIVFTLCNIIFIGMFIVSSLWLNAVQLLIYFVCNICATAAWTYKAKHSDEF